MTVDVADHVPAVGGEARGRVVGEPLFHLALLGIDGDVVVVVQRDELAQAQRAGERAGLVRDAFHQAAVAEEDPRAVIDDRVAGPVELGGQHALGDGEADGVRDALAERAGRRLDAGRAADLGMAGGHGMQLAEVPQLAHGQGVAREVQQRVEQHRAVTVRQHEAVAVGPARIGRVVLQVVAPEGLGDVGHAHRHAGVAGVGLLDCIHGQDAECVGQIGSRCHGVCDLEERKIPRGRGAGLGGF